MTRREEFDRFLDQRGELVRRTESEIERSLRSSVENHLAPDDHPLLPEEPSDTSTAPRSCRR